MKVAQSCLTLCNPMDYTVHGILQARILEWVAFSFSRGSSQPRVSTQVSPWWLKIFCYYSLIWGNIEHPFYVFVVQLLSCVWLFVNLWTAAHQSSLSFTISQSLFKLTLFESVMPSNHLVLCHCHLLLPSIFPSIRIFSNESTLCIRWPKLWSFVDFPICS